MKETASQSDKADRRYTGLKLGVLNKNQTSLADILRYVVKNPVRRLHLIAVLLNFFTFKRCFDTCSKVIRIEKVTESYFLFGNCVNVHLLSDFLRRYFGLIRRVTKSATICHPPSSSSKRFRTRNRMQMVKNLIFLGLPKSNYSLTV